MGVADTDDHTNTWAHSRPTKTHCRDSSGALQGSTPDQQGSYDEPLIKSLNPNPHPAHTSWVGNRRSGIRCGARARSERPSDAIGHAQRASRCTSPGRRQPAKCRRYGDRAVRAWRLLRSGPPGSR